MYLLISFVGCIGNVMENTGLSNIPKATLGGMFKNFSNNIRPLGVAVEEILKPVLFIAFYQLLMIF